MKDVLLFIWQLPQNILGLVLRWALSAGATGRVVFEGRQYTVVPSFPGGISLGNYVIVKKGFLEWEDAWWHEYGHTRQSRILGPLYLLVVGIPSLTWAAIWQPTWKVSYYSFYTEAWADKLGGVIR